MGERGKTGKSIDAEEGTPKPLTSKGLASYPQVSKDKGQKVKKFLPKSHLSLPKSHLCPKVKDFGKEAKIAKTVEGEEG